jgi:hypothetical protein
MYLLDTNIISEVRKGERCDARVAAWYAATRSDDLFISVLVAGEIRNGVERLRPRDPRQAEALERWLAELVHSFAERVLPIDSRVADIWGRINTARRVPVIDGLLAATARAHDMTLVTRNTSDVNGLGARVLNPFAQADVPPVT